MEGHLTQRKYTDKNGIERTAVEVIANDVQFLSPSTGDTKTDTDDPFLPDFPE